MSKLIEHINLEDMAIYSWILDDESYSDYISSILKSQSKLKELLDPLPMYALKEVSIYCFDTYIYANTRDQVMKIMVENNYSIEHILLLTKLHDLYSERPAATLSIYHVEIPENNSNGNLLEMFKQLNQGDKLYNMENNTELIEISVEETEFKDYNFQLKLTKIKRKFYIIYDPINSWMAFSSAKVSELFKIQKYIESKLKIKLSALHLGKGRVELPKEFGQMLWHSFLTKVQAELKGKITISTAYYTSLIEGKKKKGDIKLYNKVYLDDPVYVKEMAEEVKNGLFIEGVKANLKTEDYSGSIYIRDFRMRTTISLLQRRKNDLETELNFIVKLFTIFNNLIAPYKNQLGFQTTLNQFF